MYRYCVFLILVFLMACAEVPVIIPEAGTVDNTTYSQHVLIEEYTGVRCQNCPAGAKQIEELKKIYKDRFVAISVHGGFFAQPTNKENKYSLDNAFGKELIRLFNEPLGYPSAIINRKAFDNNLFIGGNSWAGHVANELKKEPIVGIDLITAKNESTKKITITGTIHGLADAVINGQLSVILVENNLKDAQLTPTGVDTNYIHQHVLRSFVTPVQGIALNPIQKNSKQPFSFETTADVKWNFQELKVIVIVHKAFPGGEIINVKEN